MKPDWDKLAKEFDGSSTAGVYDVDCTGEGKSLCDKHGVQGYPTLKYGDPEELKSYEGGRTFDELKKFADENLGPQCGPKNLDLCKDDAKSIIEGYLGMTKTDLEKSIAATEKQFKKDDKDFSKKRSKYNLKHKDFLEELEEAEEQEKIYLKEKEKFDRSKASASKPDLAKQAKKDKKHLEEKQKWLEKKEKAKAETDKLEEEGAKLDERKRLLKHAKAVLKEKQAATEEL